MRFRNEMVELRHVGGRTFRITNTKNTVMSDEEKAERDRILGHGLFTSASYARGTLHTSTSWEVDILTLNGFEHYWHHLETDRLAPKYRDEITAELCEEILRTLGESG